MAQTVIPAGYRLSIDSWENDGDYRQTEIIEGLSKERVQFLIELLSLFRSESNNDGCFGNMYDPDEGEITLAVAAMRQVMDKHRDALEDDEVDYMTDVDQYFFSEMVSTYLGSSENYWSRVFDGVKVEYTPTEIILEDVTDQFV